MFGYITDRVDVDHRAHRVQVHLRALLRDRHGQHRVGQIVVEQAARQRFRARRRGPLPHADRNDTRRQQ